MVKKKKNTFSLKENDQIKGKPDSITQRNKIISTRKKEGRSIHPRKKNA